VRIFNLLKTVRKIVEEKGAQLQYLIPIGERAEAFEERQDTTQEALRKLYELAEEYERAEEVRKKSDLPDEAFAVFWYLKSEGIEGAERVAREASAAFSEHPYWRQSEGQEREVRTALYKALISAGAKDVVKQTSGLLRMLRGASS
jgi:type I restriction enzyme, R subunit